MFLQKGILFFNSVQVVLAFGLLFQPFQSLFTSCGVGIILICDEIKKIGIGAVTDLKSAHRGNFRMHLTVFCGVIKDQEIAEKGHGNLAEFSWFYRNIRRDASTVIDLSPLSCGKLPDKRIGNFREIAIVIFMTVINGLNTTTAGDVIFGYGDL